MDWAEFIAAHIPEPQTVTVQRLQGTTGHGVDLYTTTAVKNCVTEMTRRRVAVSTQDTAGAIVVVSATVWGPPSMDAPPGSLVTLPGESEPRRVITHDHLRAHGHPLPEHVELTLE